MSLSINTYNKNVYYELMNNENVTTASERSNRKKEETNTDSVQISLAAMNQGLTSTERYTDTYGPSSVEAPLTTSELRSLLSNIQNDLQSDDDVIDDRMRTSIRELLSDVDVSMATDEEISTLFAEIMESYKPDFDTMDPNKNIGMDRRPPMPRSMDGSVPPLPPEMEGVENIDAISIETKSQLSSDNLRAILIDMQSMLSSLSLERGEDDSEGSDHTLISLQELLSGVDVSSASDEEITSLFDEWRKIVEQSH